MQKFGGSLIIDRGIALHKMIRLLTASLSGEGYLNFMGNEFGHPEWIDFPREGNGWSHHYCRRQWSLVDNPDLRYRELNDFDKAMLDLLKREKTLSKPSVCLTVHEDDKVLIFEKGNLVFAFNFHPEKSFDGYPVPAAKVGTYKVILSSDDGVFGGFDRVDKSVRYTAQDNGFRCYLPNRSAIVFKKTK